MIDKVRGNAWRHDNDIGYSGVFGCDQSNISYIINNKTQKYA